MPPLSNKNPNEFLEADIYKLITVGIYQDLGKSKTFTDTNHIFQDSLVLGPSWRMKINDLEIVYLGIYISYSKKNPFFHHQGNRVHCLLRLI